MTAPVPAAARPGATGIAPALGRFLREREAGGWSRATLHALEDALLGLNDADLARQLAAARRKGRRATGSPVAA